MLKKLYSDKVASREKNSLRRLTNLENEVNLDFSSNDYLGLSKNQIILNDGLKAAKLYGVGSTGSRLLSGNSDLFMQLEAEIARCKNAESALIFNSGFQCNVFVLSALLNKKDLGCQPVVFFDQLNHSSLYQAIFLSGAKLVRYGHNDWRHLRDLVSSSQYAKSPKFIVTETVFGMDGDVAPLAEIVDISKQHDALLYLDEAHSTGLMGKDGYGLSTELDLSEVTAVIMGTFGKALGGSGAYIACDQEIANYLINFCPGFIYSTASSPFVIGAAQKAWSLIPSLNQERERIMKNSDYLRNAMMSVEFDCGNSKTNIIPIFLGDEENANYYAQSLLAQNIKVSCIRPPTVPPRTSRIRIAIGAHHSREDIDQLIEAMKCIRKGK